MRRGEYTKRVLSGLVSMVFGTLMVLSAVILINYHSSSLQDTQADAADRVLFERNKPPKQQQVQKPRPKPKPRRSPRNPPAPLAGLNTALSGVDMGLPGFSADDLGALEGDLLGGASDVVMTDDTVDQPPRASLQAAMTFPPRARSKGIEGYVVFSLLIGVTGEIEQLNIIESYPEGVFDEAATQGINQWRFEPAMYQGQAVRAWAKQRIRFDLS